MHHSTLPLTRARFRRRRNCVLAAFLIATGLTLAGCGVNGDFGLVNRDLVRDDIHDWIGREKPVDADAPVGNFQLTDDERQLRDLAYPLLEPPYNRQKFHSVVSEYGRTPQTLQESADPRVYFAHLINIDDRSPAARYAQLIDDIRNDITRLPGFFEAAGRVLDLDNKRLQSMALVASLSRIRTGAGERARARECPRRLDGAHQPDAALGVLSVCFGAFGCHEPDAAGSRCRSGALATQRRHRAIPARHAAALVAPALARLFAIINGRPGLPAAACNSPARCSLAPSASGRAPAPVRGWRSGPSRSAIQRSAGRPR